MLLLMRYQFCGLCTAKVHEIGKMSVGQQPTTKWLLDLRPLPLSLQERKGHHHNPADTSLERLLHTRCNHTALTELIRVVVQNCVLCWNAAQA
mmetsp:Transcript_21778/g.35971  ORF Transcript_21778/g.35971 Transcript_21778/m.35971 type:complete len:93 (-) Transcript_21778:132-410(-)